MVEHPLPRRLGPPLRRIALVPPQGGRGVGAHRDHRCPPVHHDGAVPPVCWAPHDRDQRVGDGADGWWWG